METKQRCELAYRLVDRVCKYLREQSPTSQGVDPQVRSQLFTACVRVLSEYDVAQNHRRKAAQRRESCLVIDLVLTFQMVLESERDSRAFHQHMAEIKQEFGSILESFAFHDG